ncbi:MAG: DUF393 domain-containing protein [Sandaracinaceae bacterium]|nr:DUF393 domain-containing protein [Sandaracinaceae bacterium]
MTEDWRVEVFFDGDCPICVREIGMLRFMDRRGRIRFTDIAAPGFDPVAADATYETLMERIHGRLRDGTVIEGVEVFRQLYGAIGLGWLVWLTRLPLIAQALEIAYEVFADNRLRWTGRCDDLCEGHATRATDAAPFPSMASVG